MQRRRSSSRDDENQGPQTYLAKPLEEVSTELADRINKGTDIKRTISPTITIIGGELEKLAANIRSWNDYNHTYLEHAFTTAQIADEYVGVGVPLIAWGGRDTPSQRLEKLLDDLQWNIDFLTGLQDRLSLYVAPAGARVTPDAPTTESPRQRKVPAVQNMTDSQPGTVRSPEDWARANRRFIQVIYDHFNTDGDWPEIDALQRELDRLDEDALVPEDIDVAETARTMPKEIGIRDYNPPRVWLKVRALATVPAAAPLLEAVMRVVRLASKRYLAHNGAPKLSRRDLIDELGFDEGTARRVSLLLDGEPLVLGGGSGRMADADWERDLAPSFRYLRNAVTLNDYLATQAEMLSAPTPPPPIVPRPAILSSATVGTFKEPAARQASTGVKAPAGLSLTVDHLHPAIREACASRFASGHLADGVHQAAIAFRDLVRTLSGLHTLDGHDLMSRALSDRTAVVAVADLSTPTGKSIQLGTMMLAQGAMLAIRNPVAHEKVDLDPAEAMEMVAVFSLLARRLEAVTRKGDVPTNET